MSFCTSLSAVTRGRIAFVILIENVNFTSQTVHQFKLPPALYENVIFPYTKVITFFFYLWNFSVVQWFNVTISLNFVLKHNTHAED